MTSNTSLNSKLLYLPLREVQIYLNNLEAENEKLKSELTTFSRFNCILENIRRSSNKGFNALQIIDRNKSCVCNEHLNGQIRRVAQEADIELRVWQEQYDKLSLTAKHDYMATYDDDSRSTSLSPRSLECVSSPIQVAHSPEPEASMSSNNTNDSNYNINHSPAVSSRTAFISLDNSTNDSGFRSDFSEKSNQGNGSCSAPPRDSADKPNGINDERAVTPYLSPSEDTLMARSTPQVVYESRKDCRLVCDWPNCNRVFFNDDILTHHRRNHIRKSIYSCEFCSTRLLSKDELDNHMKKHILKTEPEFDKDQEEAELIVEEEDEEMIQNDNHIMDIENSSEAVNLSNKSQDTGSTLSPITALNNIQQRTDCVEKTQLTFQTVLYERLTAKSSPPPPAINCPNLQLGDPSKISPQLRTDEYKRTRYSGVGRYRCPWPDCGYTPHFLRDLRRHMYKHTGDKKHKCDYPGCDFVSVWKTSLLQHQRKKHFAANPLVNTDNSFNTRISV